MQKLKLVTRKVEFFIHPELNINAFTTKDEDEEFFQIGGKNLENSDDGISMGIRMIKYFRDHIANRHVDIIYPIENPAITFDYDGDNVEITQDSAVFSHKTERIVEFLDAIIEHHNL